MPGATRTIEVAAPLERVFDVVTHYEAYPSFLPEVKSVRLSGRQGATVDVHYQIQLIRSVRYTVRMVEERPSRISWSFVEGEVMKDNRGEWRLEEVGPGRTRITYTVEAKFGALVPRAITDKLVETSLPAMLDAFRRRAESTAT
jgi:coenzyme Q-binding protein COQ10